MKKLIDELEVNVLKHENDLKFIQEAFMSDLKNHLSGFVSSIEISIQKSKDNDRHSIGDMAHVIHNLVEAYTSIISLADTSRYRCREQLAIIEKLKAGS